MGEINIFKKIVLPIMNVEDVNCELLGSGSGIFSLVYVFTPEEMCLVSCHVLRYDRIGFIVHVIIITSGQVSPRDCLQPIRKATECR